MREKIKNVRQSDGFTIIEVLIVLAIAGLIMLIVFLAVPSLQRNSRNTQRKNDASALLTAVGEWSSNNNGVAPTDISAIVTDAYPANKRAYYKDAGDLTAIRTLAPNGGNVTQNNSEQMTLVIGGKCGTADGRQAAVPGTSRSAAVVFAVETSGATSPQCIESGI